ncbi:P-loop NTPase fold protein [Agrobacterium sp. MA01]|uniref:KAP family P-loop NTPase fold protein n=1 Tax=Agrobacterium sp. MA01 TaxID=2664893 RepID=UPI001891DCF1|nr:P-loop NTPase fold protein [Agrobacterium sp. MA01]
MIADEDIWSDDLLDRRGDAEFLISFLLGRYEERRRAKIYGSYVLNLNSGWGFGKSFFMERIGKELHKSHPVVFINAWKNDFSDDPYTMIVSELDSFFASTINAGSPEKTSKIDRALDVLKTHTGQILWAGFKGVATQTAKRYAADAVENIREVVQEALPANVRSNGDTSEAIDAGMAAIGTELSKVPEKLLDSFAQNLIEQYKATKNSQDQFRRSLEDVLRIYAAKEGSLRLPMFVLIDELDRCRPPYAIALLERIKHLFDVDDIIFIVATDTEQLSHSIRGVYGDDFDSTRYLQRFFSRSYYLADPKPAAFIDAYIRATGTDVSKLRAIANLNTINYIAELSIRLKMSLREIERAMDILSGLTTTWHHSFPIQLSVMFPMIYGFIQQADIVDRSGNSWYRQTLKSIAPWSITLEREGVIGADVQRVEANLWSLDYFDSGGKPLRAVVRQKREEIRTRRGDNDIFLQETLDQFQTELSARSRDEFPDESPSLIKQYPDMIMRAGSLR